MGNLRAERRRQQVARRRTGWTSGFWSTRVSVSKQAEPETAALSLSLRSAIEPGDPHGYTGPRWRLQRKGRGVAITDVSASRGPSRRDDTEGDCKMSKRKFSPYATVTFTAMLLLSGCVSQQKYDALDTRYQELNQTMSAQVAADQMHITRLQNAIKVTINNELMFPSGGWQMPVEAQQTISKIVPILAPMQQTKILVNGYTDNVPIGPELMREGITSNGTVKKAGGQRDAVHDLTGSHPKLVSAQGLGEADPVASNDTPEGRAQNRRVELTLAGSDN